MVPPLNTGAYEKSLDWAPSLILNLCAPSPLENSLYLFGSVEQSTVVHLSERALQTVLNLLTIPHWPSASRSKVCVIFAESCLNALRGVCTLDWMTNLTCLTLTVHSPTKSNKGKWRKCAKSDYVIEAGLIWERNRCPGSKPWNSRSKRANLHLLGGKMLLVLK